MIKYLIKVLLDLPTLAIILSLLLAFSNSYRSVMPKRSIIIGTALGSILAIIAAILKSRTQPIVTEYIYIGVLSTSMVSALIYMIFAWGLFKSKLPRLNCYAISIGSFLLMATLVYMVLPGILAYPTEFRDQLDDSLFSTDVLFKSIGYTLGLLISFLLGLSLYAIATHIKKYLLITLLLTFILIINALNQFGVILQIMLGRRMIPITDAVFEFVQLSSNYGGYFFYVIAAIAIVPAIVLWFMSLHPTDLAKNRAEKRKIKAKSRNQRRWSMLMLATLILSLIIVTVVKYYHEKEIELSPVEESTIVGDKMIIPLEQVNDGHLHRFAHVTKDQIEIRFIVIKKNDVAYGVGFDACDICGIAGYYERNGQIVCRRCDVVMNVSTIGFKGGCNPVPLAYKVVDGKMVIEINDLEAEKKRFRK